VHILQIGTGFASIPPKGAFATERTIHNLSDAMIALGHEVTLIDIEEKERPEVPYRIEAVPFRWRRDGNLPTHLLRGFSFSRAVYKKLCQLLENEKYSVVNFHNQFSARHIPMVKKYHIPCVYSLHNALWYDIRACQSARQRLLFYQDIRAMHLARIVICENETTSHNLGEIFGIPRKNRAVIPPGIDSVWCKSVVISEEKRTSYSHSDGPVILNVARIAPYKNQVTLVQAFGRVVREVPDARLILAGPVSDKKYHRELRRVISEEELASRVIFTGEILHADLPEIYTLSTVFVCPSITEAFGVVVMEAMAQGKAVIASDIETFQAMLARGRGITVPPLDSRALAIAIISLLKNESLRKEMGEQAREYVCANYTWENVAKKTIRTYEILLGLK